LIEKKLAAAAKAEIIQAIKKKPRLTMPRATEETLQNDLWLLGKFYPHLGLFSFTLEFFLSA
jgi:hypothetical protein